MNKTLLFSLMFCVTAAHAQSFVAQSLKPSPQLPATASARYQLLIPADTGKPLPLVIYLHGAGSKGDDNEKPLKESFAVLLASTELQKRFPCFVLVPQCKAGEDSLGRPNNWVKWIDQKVNPPAKWEQSEAESSDQLQGAMVALAEVLANHRVDRARMYLTGVSMGGSASWWWAAHEPQRFAAVVTCCGLSEVTKARQLKQQPIWCFHGSDDPIAPVARTRSMVEALKTMGAPVKFTEYTGEGHNIAGHALKDSGVLEWLFAQRKDATP